MHPEAFDYLTRAARRYLEPGALVLEFGSYNVNGTVRDAFPHAGRYHGVDIRPGPCVDEVADAADYQGGGVYDVVVTASAMEHMARAGDVIAAAARALRPGGLLIATTVAAEWPPHNNDGVNDDGTGRVFANGEHYAAIDPGEMRGWLDGWEILDFRHDPRTGDLFATARRP